MHMHGAQPARAQRRGERECVQKRAGIQPAAVADDDAAMGIGRQVRQRQFGRHAAMVARPAGAAVSVLRR